MANGAVRIACRNATRSSSFATSNRRLILTRLNGATCRQRSASRCFKASVDMRGIGDDIARPTLSPQEVADAIEAVPLRRGEREAGATPRLLRVLFVNRTRTGYAQSRRAARPRCENEGARGGGRPAGASATARTSLGRAASPTTCVRRVARTCSWARTAPVSRTPSSSKGGSLVEVRPYNEGSVARK